MKKSNAQKAITARQNMMDCQITPNGVITPAIINAFASTPREAFVPEVMENVAYMDDDILLGQGRYMMEPMVHARMLEILQPKSTDLALDIACGTGYSSAILSMLVSTVVTVENDKALLEHAESNWSDLNIGNIAAYHADLNLGDDEHAPFDCIVINGAVAHVPESLTAQLKEGGRLITIVKPADAVMGQVTMFENLGTRGVASRIMFEAASVYLPGFAPETKFVF